MIFICRLVEKLGVEYFIYIMLCRFLSVTWDIFFLRNFCEHTRREDVKRVSGSQ